jgi:hypothetical protein
VPRHRVVNQELTRDCHSERGGVSPLALLLGVSPSFKTDSLESARRIDVVRESRPEFRRVPLVAALGRQCVDASSQILSDFCGCLDLPTPEISGKKGGAKK